MRVFMTRRKPRCIKVIEYHSRHVFFTCVPNDLENSLKLLLFQLTNGMFVFPGGRYESIWDGNDVFNTAQRELEEESQISKEALRVLRNETIPFESLWFDLLWQVSLGIFSSEFYIVTPYEDIYSGLLQPRDSEIERAEWIYFKDIYKGLYDKVLYSNIKQACAESFREIERGLKANYFLSLKTD